MASIFDMMRGVPQTQVQPSSGMQNYMQRLQQLRQARQPQPMQQPRPMQALPAQMPAQTVQRMSPGAEASLLQQGLQAVPTDQQMAQRSALLQQQFMNSAAGQQGMSQLNALQNQIRANPNDMNLQNQYRSAQQGFQQSMFGSSPDFAALQTQNDAMNADLERQRMLAQQQGPQAMLGQAQQNFPGMGLGQAAQAGGLGSFLPQSFTNMGPTSGLAGQQPQVGGLRQAMNMAGGSGFLKQSGLGGGGGI